MADRFVVDASVAAKWFLQDEADTALADDLLIALLVGDLELHAPRHFLYEVCGLLTKACLSIDHSTGSPRATRTHALECVQELYEITIAIHETDAEQAAEALEAAVDFHKLYSDMVYVKLAERLGCQWCTADAKFLRAIPSDFPIHLVVNLSSLR
jgi:predicted nucleic acid-binding protein